MSKEYRAAARHPQRAVYNLAIPDIIPNSASRVPRDSTCLRFAGRLLLISALALPAGAADWNAPEQQLAKKIVAAAGTGPAYLTIENRSSLSLRDSEAIQNGLRTALRNLGLRLASEPASVTVAISLSENITSYVWVGDVRHGTSAEEIAIVSVPRPAGASTGRDSVPLSLHKTLLWTQVEPILDVAVLEEGVTPIRIAVLDPRKVSMLRWQGGKWQEEQAADLSHDKPWPRDIRGRLILNKDRSLDAYLPGVSCHSNSSSPFALTCRESEDPWPLVTPALVGTSAAGFTGGSTLNGPSATVPWVRAFYAPSRNFFTGALTPALGISETVPQFYTAASVPREQSVLWIFAAVDGHVHMIDGVSDRAAAPSWGSELASLKTACGAGWQVLATSSRSDEQGAIRAYEFPEPDPVAVSAAVELSGNITALWTEQRGDTAVAISKNRETGSYEAFRLSLACAQ